MLAGSDIPEAPARRSAPPCPIVGLGASAGGLEAFRELLEQVPRDVGASFVVVQHLSPLHRSYLPELLSGHGPLPVEEARDDQELVANRVFVVPAGVTASLRRGRLRLVPGPPEGDGPLDAFFRSLARDQRDLAVAIVLSGSGTDGVKGALEVEREGGLALVQEPGTAGHDGMPRAAIEAGVRGPALPVPDLARTVVRHVAAIASRCQGPVALSRGGVTEIPPQVWKALSDATGRDLSGYKPGAVARRIARRMQRLEVDALSSYLELLAADPEEPHALLQELLIGVTSFFRDADVFEALELRILPRLVAQLPDDRELRIWVPGCATGEEAYSIAMLLREAAPRAQRALRVQIFATDLDAAALEHARAGVYSRDAVQAVRPDRLSRFFVPRDDGYAVAKELREICLFTAHHLTGDPPFSRLDLVSCRNVLIYLENELKRQVLPVFHYALRPGGVLLLGPSESVGDHDDLFAPLDPRLRLYERRDSGPRLPLRFRLSARGAPRGTPPPRPGAPLSRETTMRTYEQVLLRELSPAAAVVDAAGQVLHFSGPVGRFLGPPQGPPTNLVVDLALEGLRLDLRAALHAAVRDHAPVVQRRIALQIGGAPALVDLHVQPLDSAGADQFLVVFRELPRPEPAPAEREGDPAIVEQLRAELRSKREHLQATIEELESSNAQLKVTNEELVTLNEELQSSNEELQTSQEELQSLNEELQTLNSELSTKIEELDRANSDLQNLLQSTQVAALFVGKDLRIKRFTPAATQLFRLIEGDVGRPLGDVVTRFEGGELLADVDAVARTLVARERQVRSVETGAWYVLRVLPYVTLEQVVDGVVVTFSDVSEVKRAEAAQRESERQVREILESLPLLVWTGRPDGSREGFSPQWIAYTGAPAEEQRGFGWLQHVHPEDRDRVREVWQASVDRGVPYHSELRLRRADGVYRWFQSRAVALRGAEGNVRRWLGFSADIDDLKRAEAARREGERTLRAAIDAFPGVFVIYDAQRRIQFVNSLAASFELGARRGDLVGRRDEEVVPPELAQRYVPILELAIATGEPQSFEIEAPWGGGGTRTVLVRYVPLVVDGKVEQVLGVSLDITDRKRMEESLREADRRKDAFLAVLGHELRNPLAPLRNAVQLVRRAPGDAGGVARAAGIMERQVEQLARLVDDLLDVSRMTRGKATLQRRRLDLVALARTAVEDHQAVAANAGVRLAADLPESPIWLEGDAARLTQVVGNLLQNGLKFTEGGGEVRLVLGRDGPDGRRARLDVRDTGVGIAPELLEHVFQPFTQGEGVGARRGGLGLGLTLVKGIVEMHGGQVRAASPGPGGGATLTVELQCEPFRGLRADGPGAAATRRVLLVDDNSDAAETLAELLRLDGHEVEVAADGPRGLESARRFVPDVAICDIGLPSPMDGYALARALRGEPALRDTYLVALTGYAGPEDRRRAREAGFDLHLAKPPSLDELRQALGRGPRA